MFKKNEAELYDIDFKNSNYEGKHYKGKIFDTCRFTDCNLKGCIFENCTFENCSFTNCDISLLQVKQSIFSTVKIINCKAIGIMWNDAKEPLLLHFDNSNLSYSGFYGKNLKKIHFTKCIACDIDFTNCVLSGANFSGTDFLNARFSNTDLSQANFTDATNYSIDIQQNNIKKATFKLPEALSLLQSLNVVIVE